MAKKSKHTYSGNSRVTRGSVQAGHMYKKKNRKNFQKTNAANTLEPRGQNNVTKETVFGVKHKNILQDYNFVFNLGSNIGITFAELCEIFECKPDKVYRYQNHIFANIEEKKVEKYFSKLGGAQKVSKILLVTELGIKSTQLAKEIANNVNLDFNNKALGVNIYGKLGKTGIDLKLEIAEALREKVGKRVKLVGRLNQDIANSATTIKIFKKGGLEINIYPLPDLNKIVVTTTTQVQGIDFWSALDYEKPHRDMQIGMLPSKLARIMLNLAHLPSEEAGFWDPFCGLGTIIMQGQLLDVYSYGSDINKNAVLMAQENVEWLKERGFVKELKYNIFKHDIKKNPLSNKILRDIAGHGKFDAIVTEPYLGEPRTKPFTTHKQAAAAWAKLKPLYRAFLRNVSYLLNPGGRVVFVVPMFKIKSTKSFGNNKRNGQRKKVPEFWYAPKPEINKNRWHIHKFNTGPLVWKRPRSVVARQIVVISKL